MYKKLMRNAIKHNELITLNYGIRIYACLKEIAKRHEDCNFGNESIALLKEYNEKVGFAVCGSMANTHVSLDGEFTIYISTEHMTYSQDGKTLTLHIDNDTFYRIMEASHNPREIYVSVSAKNTEDGLDFNHLTIKDIFEINYGDLAVARYNGNYLQLLKMGDVEDVKKISEYINTKKPMPLTFKNMFYVDLLSSDKRLDYCMNVGFIVSGTILHTGCADVTFVEKIIELDSDYSMTGKASLYFMGECNNLCAEYDGKHITAIVTNVNHTVFEYSMDLKEIISIE